MSSARRRGSRPLCAMGQPPPPRAPPPARQSGRPQSLVVSTFGGYRNLGRGGAPDSGSSSAAPPFWRDRLDQRDLGVLERYEQLEQSDYRSPFACGCSEALAPMTLPTGCTGNVVDTNSPRRSLPCGIDWLYVGDGQGAYTVEHMRYVGQGRGNFNQQAAGATPTGPRIVKACALVLLGATLSYALCVAASSLVREGRGVRLSGWIGGHGGHNSPVTGAMAQFDCQAEQEVWSTAWSSVKKNWCCTHAGIGCASEPYVDRSASSGTMNCSKDATQAWTDAKRSWCCNHEGAGCTDVSTEEYDCQSGTSTWQRAWSLHKQAWCCDHFDIACSDESLSTTTPAGTCNAICDIEGRSWTCKDRVERIAHSQFSWKKGACGLAHDIVVSRCPSCRSCSVTQIRKELNCFEGASAQRTWKGTSDMGCNEVCTYQGVSGTCAVRVQFTANSVFNGRPDRCSRAFGVVLQACPVCLGCPLTETGCNVPSGSS